MLRLYRYGIDRVDNVKHNIDEVRRIISTLEKVLFKRGPGRESGPGGPPRVYPGCWLTGPAGRGTR